MPKQKRSISEPEKKFVAARQKWRCSSCDNLLESTYQVDHTIALMNGGEDSVSNMTAMCVSCHCKKTQIEHIDRATIRRNKEEKYPHREDIVIKDGRMIKCSVCLKIRNVHSKWEAHVCSGPPVEKADLSYFTFRGFNKKC